MSPDYRVISKIGHMLQHTHIYIHIYIYIHGVYIYIHHIYETRGSQRSWALGPRVFHQTGLQDLIAETVGNS